MTLLDMGYSNVAGDLNVYGTSTLSNLVVNGSTQHYGPITSTSNAAFANLVASNLTVTGNFTVTATNTSVSNALSIVNQGSATALYVNQNESVAHIHNVAEFYDHTTVAMIIDPNGNIAVHTTSSPGYALTVIGGVSTDQLTLGTPLSISSGGTGTATGATQNYVFAGPSIGSAGAPSFRALVNADLPSSISVSNISANGAALYALNSSNLVGNVANANVALVVSQASQPNITSVGTLTGLNVSGILSATLHVGNASALSNLNSSNLVGVVASATTALVVSQASQPNITSVGTLTGLNVQGFLVASNGSGISNLNSSNLVGNVANANVALVVSQASQPNITSVGTLTGLNVQGLLVVSNGSGISNLNSSNLVGNVANANVALVVSQASQPNITSVGTLTGLTVSGLLIASNASGLSNVNGSNVSTVPTAQSVTVAAQPNITSVGTLTGLNVQGLLIASNGSGISNLNSSNLVGNVANANVALVVSQASQPNITSVGTLTGLNVQGLLVASNASGLSNLSASNVVLGTLSTSVFPTSGVTAGSYGSSANVSQVSVDTYGRVTAAANVAITSSQWTTGTGNIYYLSNVGIGTSAVSANLSVTGNVYVSNALQTTNIFAGNLTTSQSASFLSSASGTQSSSQNFPNQNPTGTGSTGAWTVTTALGTYYMSASSEKTAQAAWEAFGISAGSAGFWEPFTLNTYSATNPYQYTAGTYSTSDTNSNSYGGEWLQLQSPVQISITSLSLYPYSSAYAPGAVVVLGKNGSAGNTGWTLISNFSGLTGANQTLTTGTPANFTYLRFVFTNLYAAGNQSNPQPALSLLVTGTYFIPNSLAVSIYSSGAVGIGITNPTASLQIVGNVYASNAVTTTNAYLTGTLNVQGTSNLYVANIANIFTTNIVGFVGSQWTSGTGNIYYLSNVGIGTSAVMSNLAVIGNIYASNALQTTNVLATSANLLSIQTSNLIPATQGLFMNLQSNFTLTGNWYGNIAGTITSNLYTLFNSTGGQTWNAYGQSAGPIIRGPTANGGFTFAQTGPYSMTCSIASVSGVKTLAISSNAADIHSNVTNVWSYCFRYSFGEIPSIPVTLPFYVSSTSTYYYLDIETNVQGDTVYQTAYSNLAANAYTGSYVIIRPI